jgi:hypothetical protein
MFPHFVIKFSHSRTGPWPWTSLSLPYLTILLIINFFFIVPGKCEIIKEAEAGRMDGPIKSSRYFNRCKFSRHPNWGRSALGSPWTAGRSRHGRRTGTISRWRGGSRARARCSDAKGRARKSVLRCGTNLRIQHPFKSINNKNGKGRTRIFTSIAIHLKISFCYKLYFNVVDAAWFSQEGPHVVRQLECRPRWDKKLNVNCPATQQPQQQFTGPAAGLEIILSNV